jgi:hypothetical protein
MGRAINLQRLQTPIKKRKEKRAMLLLQTCAKTRYVSQTMKHE